MKDQLAIMTKEWMALERKTLEQRKAADKYYDDNLMKLIESKFVRSNKDILPRPAEHMVIPVGTSYEPIVLNLALTKPKKVLFLYTEKSAPTLDKVIRYSQIESSSYEKHKIHETDPIDIYRVIKSVYLSWGRPEQMYIDITGGTKAMSAAASLAGTMVNVQVIYVASDDYLLDFRKPRPGSERMVFIDDPVSVFGDLEIEKALELFHKFNFSGAAEKTEKLKEEIPEPDLRQQVEFIYLLARAYEAWDALEFEGAYRYLETLNHKIERDRRLHEEFLLMDFAPEIRKQKEILSDLRRIPPLIREHKQTDILKSKELITALMFTMQQNALTRVKQEKYDMATLLLYRVLEMIEQRRLMRYNLYVSSMDYEQIRIDLKQCPNVKGMSLQEQKAWLKNEVQNIRSQLFRKYNDYLPEQISLMDGFILLAALRDPIATDDEEKNYVTLKQIRSRVSLRNNSIFAHGLGPVGVEDYKRFEEFVLRMFRRFCVIEKIDYDTYSGSMEWIDPIKSAYYTAGRAELS